MSETLTAGQAKTKKRMRITMIVLIGFLIKGILAIIVLITVPFMPLPLTEEILPIPDSAITYTIVPSKGRDYIYVALPDAKEMINILIPRTWSLASQFRFHLKSPHYLKTADVICRITFRRESLIKPFRQICVRVTADDSLRMFADGHQKLMEEGARVKAQYHAYRSLGLAD